MFVGKNIAIWGTGDVGRGIANNLIDLNYKLYAFIDSNIEKCEHRIMGISVVSPALFENIINDIDIVIIGVESAKAREEIRSAISKIRRKMNCDSLVVYSSEEARNHICEKYIATKTKNMKFRWDIDFNNCVKDWIENLDSEIEYWIRILKNKELNKDYLDRLGNNAFAGLDHSIEQIGNNLSNNAVVIDLGCGVLTMYGSCTSKGNVRVIPVDPLAAFYNKMNKNYSPMEWDRTKECRFGLFEFIDSFFPEEYADLIIINNALDHCIDPYRSIVKCIRVLKNGGMLRLFHRRAEAVYEGWIGLHKWNIDYNNDDELILWNKTDKINVSKELNGYADVLLKHTDGLVARDSYVVAEITKSRSRDEIDEQSGYKEDSNKLAFVLGEFIRKNAELFEM